MRKLISLSVAFLFLSILVGAAPVQIELWGEYTGFEALGLNDAVDAYNAAHPNVHVVYTGQQGVDTKVLAAVRAGNPPNVSEIGNNENFPQMVEGGIYIPLDDLLKSKSFNLNSFWQPWTSMACSIDGKTYGIPLTDWTLLLIYNKKMFKDAGLDPNKPPRTIEEFTAAQRKLTKKDAQGNITQTGLEWRATFPAWFASYYSYMFGATPATLYDAKAKKYLKPEALYQTWQWLQSFPKEFGADAMRKFASGLGSWGTSAEPFLSGKMAMSLNGPWIADHIRRYSPGMDWGVAPAPSVPAVANKGTFAWFGMDQMAIPKGAKNNAETLDFMIWFSGRQGQFIYDAGPKGTGRVPTTRDFGGADFFKAAVPVNPKLSAWIDSLSSPVLQPIPFFSPAQAAYNQEFGAILDPVLTLQVDAKTAVDTAVSRAQAVLDRM
ncbi:MAG: ABC transporter substrate-binding protein [Spirochaetia bacterium]|jgi:multiple sugar transport system substrate-binding protein